MWGGFASVAEDGVAGGVRKKNGTAGERELTPMVELLNSGDFELTLGVVDFILPPLKTIESSGISPMLGVVSVWGPCDKLAGGVCGEPVVVASA